MDGVFQEYRGATHCMKLQPDKLSLYVSEIAESDVAVGRAVCDTLPFKTSLTSIPSIAHGLASVFAAGLLSEK